MKKIFLTGLPGFISTRLVRSIYKMPAQLVDYFVHDVRYDSSQTKEALQKHGLSCPKFVDYLPNVVKFFQSQ
ncbi:MAG: hypothetical protein M1470_04480 [Bacteroidetes bacterium]|nr:hypothetical protein [Bacteroidota bacterium]MCL5738736.1 hypothetical protein [Bacteroidota bacterium]